MTDPTCLRSRYDCWDGKIRNPDAWAKDEEVLHYWGYSMISMIPGFVLSSVDGTTVQFQTDGAAIHFLNILSTAKSVGLNFDPASMEADNDS